MKNRKNASITRHPLFPAMVCLWFAALFGLGSLAIRPSLLESAVLALHIDLMVPAAAPPLGITARIILALGMFVIGAVIGLLLALRLARPKTEAPARRRGAKAADQSVMRGSAGNYGEAHADNDDFARLDAARAEQATTALPGRRRALAMEEQYERTHHEMAPVPGALAYESVPEFTPVAAHNLDPRILDLADIVIDEHPAEEFAGEEVAEAVGAPAHVFDSGPVAVEAPGRRAFDTPVSAQPPVVEAAVASFAPAEPGVAADIAPAPVAAEPPVSPPSFSLPRDGAEKLMGAPLESLGVVQLAERLALAIARRRDGVTAAAVMPPLPSFAPAAPMQVEEDLIAPKFADLTVIQPEPAAPEQVFGAPPPMPAALRPISFHDEENDHEPVASILPPRRFAMPTAITTPVPIVAPAQSEPEQSDLSDASVELADEAQAGSITPLHKADVGENGYGSLLAIKPVLRPNPLMAEAPVFEDEAAPVEVDADEIEWDEDEPAEPETAHGDAEFDIEPVVIFPGQGQFSAPAAVPAVDTPTSPSVLSASGVRRFDAPPSDPTPLRVSFPAAAKVDPQETERALKAALATLQRMSGAA